MEQKTNDLACSVLCVYDVVHFIACNVVGGENQVAIDLIVKHVHLKLKEV